MLSQDDKQRSNQTTLTLCSYEEEFCSRCANIERSNKEYNERIENIRREMNKNGPITSRELLDEEKKRIILRSIERALFNFKSWEFIAYLGITEQTYLAWFRSNRTPHYRGAGPKIVRLYNLYIKYKDYLDKLDEKGKELFTSVLMTTPK